MIKKVAAVFINTSEEGLSGPFPQITESTKLAQLTRQIRNIRKVIFSNIVVITLLVFTWFHLFKRYAGSSVVLARVIYFQHENTHCRRGDSCPHRCWGSMVGEQERYGISGLQKCYLLH